MQYLGGKYRIRKKLGAFLTEQAKGKAFFLDMFCGAGNVVANVSHPRRYANDGNRYIIAVLKRAQRGGEFPDVITEDFYQQVKNNKDAYPDWLVGFVGFGCSFGGKFFRGYGARSRVGSGFNVPGIGKGLATLNLTSVQFSSNLFEAVTVPKASLQGLIYCDPPYEGTTDYSIAFDTEQFYKWAREQAQKHTVLVSEYEHNSRGPILWQTTSKQGLRSATGKAITSEVVFQVLP
jgi:DNA adenine methylase